ncbi:hypothetical protein BDB01DRAFT_451299 [Pilobolus umbonatus]|nr:hypothetical protein BDB01DRAFT_451299 [Pilobolus umbonatus]
MDSLPVEIRDKITSDFTRSDLCNCLVICHSWYSLFIPLLYKDIRIYFDHKLKQFYRAITTYPRCIQAGRYVHSLDISALVVLRKFRPIMDMKVDIIHMINRCPNIKELRVEGRLEMIHTLMSPHMPHLHRLKSLYFDDTDREGNACVMECYYKYRSTLEYLGMKNMSHELI